MPDDDRNGSTHEHVQYICKRETKIQNQIENKKKNSDRKGGGICGNIKEQIKTGNKDNQSSDRGDIQDNMNGTGKTRTMHERTMETDSRDAKVTFKSEKEKRKKKRKEKETGGNTKGKTHDEIESD